MTRDPRDTSAAEPDGENLHVRIQRGPGLGNRPGLLNNDGRLVVPGRLVNPLTVGPAGTGDLPVGELDLPLEHAAAHPRDAVRPVHTLAALVHLVRTPKGTHGARAQ
jgi:hypothetical protein